MLFWPCPAKSLFQESSRICQRTYAFRDLSISHIPLRNLRLDRRIE